ncbi:MAG TPA: hypothetical protein VHE55_02130 [Fimbriimonadaceae bacterium]|nr:hypothetical protein [Fimbriimonadaceae bacterium]
MRFLVAFLLLWPLAVPAQSDGPIDLKLAARYFQEAKWASDDDGGKLWGKPLYGPMIFADPQTREIVANQADPEGKLAEKDGVWVGKLSPEVGIANTATQWAGLRWTMVMWPLPDAPAIRTMLMMHECWHRIQDEIGLPAARQDNNHLDTKEGRIWLRLEWRALSAALISWGPERKQAISDALLFRAYRRSLFPLAATQEDRMELHEGMAEYTGVRFMGLGDWGRRSYLSGRIKINALKPSYPLSFAYETGPAYGLLLDVDSKPWRETLKPGGSLSGLLQQFEGISLPGNLAALARVRADAYDGKQVFAEEEKRDKDRKAEIAKYRKLLVDGPVLELPMIHNNYGYDPNQVFPLGDLGLLLPESYISDDWGVIEVKKGVLISSKGGKAFVSAPTSADGLQGDGWKLTLKPGWKVLPGARKGDFKIAKE